MAHDDGGEADGDETAPSSLCDVFLAELKRYCYRMFGQHVVLPLTLAAMMITGTCVLIGWNERRAVCASWIAVRGREQVEEVGCGGAADNNGELVAFSCDLKRDSFPIFAGEGDFASHLSFQGLGLRTHAEIYQCVELADHNYERRWVTEPVDSSQFNRKQSVSYRANCGESVENPGWPAGAPRSSTRRASEGRAGAYRVPAEGFLDQVPLETPVQASAEPQAWQWSGAHSTYTLASNYTNNLGDVRVRFYGNDWSATEVSVVGYHDASVVQSWSVSASWLCPGFTIGELRPGVHDADTFFVQDAAYVGWAEAGVPTWAIRCTALGLLWWACCCIFAPLQLAAGLVPWFGPCFGESVALIVGCVTCPLACALGFGVIGALWVPVSPVFGLTMMTVFCLCLCGFVTCYTWIKDVLHASEDDLPTVGPVVAQPIGREPPAAAPLEGEHEREHELGEASPAAAGLAPPAGQRDDGDDDDDDAQVVVAEV